MPEFVQVQTTTASEEDARRIARALVEERLAACVQIVGPITSTYWWQGRIESSQEWLCCIKTSQALYASVESTVLNLHPYDEPEILATPVVAGSDGYVKWLVTELKSETED